MFYEMRQDGLREVSNPSELLLSTAREGLSGVAIAAAVEGVRPFLIEVQALVQVRDLPGLRVRPPAEPVVVAVFPIREPGADPLDELPPPALVPYGCV